MSRRSAPDPRRLAAGLAMGALALPALFGGGSIPWAQCGIIPWGPSPLEGQAVPPHARYRTFDTPHFQIVYAEGLREVALRAAAHAEEAHRVLREEFLPAPSPTIEVLVTDHSDISNGLALAAPRPRITLWARPPTDGSALADYDEWIRLVTVHEVAHIFHLDRTGALGGVLRRIFGRVPSQWPFFPGYLLPLWAIEGTAVALESAHTDGGRIHGTAHASIIRAHALDGGVESLGQALGNSPVWPGGTRPYVYGSLFFHWMEETYGPEAVGDFLESSARQWIPYRLNAAAREATGRSLDDLWAEWARERVPEAMVGAEGGGAEVDGGARPEPVTRGGRLAAHPLPDGAGGLVYSRSDGRSDARLVHRDSLGRERDLARWNNVPAATWTPDEALLASQVDFTDPWHLVHDLYRVELDGSVNRVTRGMRISYANAHPVTGEVVAVQEGEGTNRLILLTPDGSVRSVLREAELHVHWAFPRWSPDGRAVAVVRREVGGRMGVVLLGVEPHVGGGGGIEPLLVDRSLHTAPAWSPDGRWLLWASDRTGALNVYAREVEDGRPVGPLRQVTWTPAGASQPAVDPQGRWLYMSVLGKDGWDLARLPFDPDLWRDPRPPRPRFTADEGDSASALLVPEAVITRADRPWSPYRSLLPAYWFLTGVGSEVVGEHEVLPWALGIESSGADLVGRNRWSFHAAVPVRDPSRRPELRANWRWAGLGQPALRLSASQRMRTLGFIVPDPEGMPGDTLYPVARELRAGLDVEVIRRRIRSAAVAFVGIAEVRESRDILEPDGEVSERFGLRQPRRTLSEVRVGAAASTVRSHSFSISPEQGVAASAVARQRWERALPDSVVGVPGRDGSFRDLVAVGRAFLPLPPLFPGRGASFARSALGVRAAIGLADGPGVTGSHFLVGGGGGGADRALGFTYDDENPTFSVRGVPRGVVRGDRAWAASVELRVPVANFHRGWGALPIHLDRLAAGLFFDVAGARARPAGEATPQWRRRSSAGLEAALSHTFFFGRGSQSRMGVAVPLEEGGEPAVYVQVDWSF